MTRAGEMSLGDFHQAIKWLCDVSRQHEDQWLLDHTTTIVCQSFN